MAFQQQRYLFNHPTTRPRWSSDYRACHRTHGSRVQTRPTTIYFKGNKLPQHDFLRKEVKQLVPCRKILHVKDLYVMQHILVGKILGTFLAKFLLLHYQVSLLITVRKLRCVWIRNNYNSAGEAQYNVQWTQNNCEFR
jgi:hypothetical protein